MVLMGGHVQLPIVNVHSLTYDYSSRNQLIILILYNCHPPFLRDNMDRAYPLTIGYRVDNADLKIKGLCHLPLKCHACTQKGELL